MTIETEQNRIKSLLISLHRFTNDQGCWLKSYKHDWSVYGYAKWKGKNVAIHRLSALAFQNYNLESKSIVCHHCDIKGCFNPDHLYIGNYTTNKNDWINRKRYKRTLPFGEFIYQLEKELNLRFDLIGI